MPEGVSTEQLLVQPSEQAQNQAAVQEPGTLQQEVHALADSLVSEQKTSDTPAQRERIFDEQGKIVDIAFTQNGKKATLKSVLPGTYTIEIIHDEKANSKAYKKANKISVNASNGRDFNLVLLHEAGHMVDYQRNQSQYQKLEMEALKSRLSE